MPIEKEIFAKPSGMVQGVVVAMCAIRGKERRIAHATLLVSSPPDISMDVPKSRIEHQDLVEIVKVLDEFAKVLADLKQRA